MANSTLLNNHKTTYLINNNNLLIPRSFVLIKDFETIEAEILFLLILGINKRLFSKCFNKIQRKKIEDLILKNIAIIKGFHFNIIFKARLLKAGI